ncbi:spherulation-specific family 4 protein [Pilimelia columellifera]|uniref:Spherulation-specific family 4 n=1 Tax=Pilimelia columellifera subsp. columellifera TaxID=706583 RepID=A0ABN3N4C1_9ACTN
MRALLPLYKHPVDDPDLWERAAALGARATIVVNVHNGPGVELEPPYVAATGRLAQRGTPMLGYVDLGYAERPLPAVLADVAAWRRYPVNGILFDQAPTGVDQVTAVAVAVSAARRAGFDEVVLNPGTPPAPVYRELGAQLCVFEGPWSAYLPWTGEGVRRGDGHLVYAVPDNLVDDARRTLAARGAGFGLVTERRAPLPYAGLPRWMISPAPATT